MKAAVEELFRIEKQQRQLQFPNPSKTPTPHITPNRHERSAGDPGKPSPWDALLHLSAASPPDKGRLSLPGILRGSSDGVGFLWALKGLGLRGLT